MTLPHIVTGKGDFRYNYVVEAATQMSLSYSQTWLPALHGNSHGSVIFIDNRDLQLGVFSLPPSPLLPSLVSALTFTYHTESWKPLICRFAPNAKLLILYSARVKCERHVETIYSKTLSLDGQMKCPPPIMEIPLLLMMLNGPPQTSQLRNLDYILDTVE